MATAAQAQRPTTQELFEAYHVGWEARDADAIAVSHTPDTLFWLHDGSEPIVGREALRDHCRGLFDTFDFTLERKRLLFGDDHWVFEWTMLLSLAEPEGAPFETRVEMLDVVTVDASGGVVRKDVYANGAQMQAAFARAGLEKP